MRLLLYLKTPSLTDYGVSEFGLNTEQPPAIYSHQLLVATGDGIPRLDKI